MTCARFVANFDLIVVSYWSRFVTSQCSWQRQCFCRSFLSLRKVFFRLFFFFYRQSLISVRSALRLGTEPTVVKKWSRTSVIHHDDHVRSCRVLTALRCNVQYVTEGPPRPVDLADGRRDEGLTVAPWPNSRNSLAKGRKLSEKAFTWRHGMRPHGAVDSWVLWLPSHVLCVWIAGELAKPASCSCQCSLHPDRSTSAPEQSSCIPLLCDWRASVRPGSDLCVWRTSARVCNRQRLPGPSPNATCSDGARADLSSRARSQPLRTRWSW